MILRRTKEPINTSKQPINSHDSSTYGGDHKEHSAPEQSVGTDLLGIVSHEHGDGALEYDTVDRHHEALEERNAGKEEDRGGGQEEEGGRKERG